MTRLRFAAALLVALVRLLALLLRLKPYDIAGEACSRLELDERRIWGDR